MFTLYKVVFFFRHNVQTLQAIHVSERNQRAAVKRARAFVASHYPEAVVKESVTAICTTPDDVLDWS